MNVESAPAAGRDRGSRPRVAPGATDCLARSLPDPNR